MPLSKLWHFQVETPTARLQQWGGFLSRGFRLVHGRTPLLCKTQDPIKEAINVTASCHSKVWFIVHPSLLFLLKMHLLGNAHSSDHFLWKVYVNIRSASLGLLHIKVTQVSMTIFWLYVQNIECSLKVKPGRTLANQGLWSGRDIWMVSFLIQCQTFENWSWRRN